LIVISLIILFLSLPIFRSSFAGYLIALPLLPIWALLEAFKLSVHVDQDRISMKMRPFTSKSHTWDEIDTAEVIDYGFVGGWGIRITKSYGMVYNARDSKGILIHPKDGKKFVFGIQSVGEAKKVISNYT